MFGIDIYDFFNGRYCADKLANLIDWLQKERTSYLSHAQATDVEHYRAVRDANGGKVPKRKATPPALFEWTWEHEALASLFSLMQQHIHVSSQSKKKAKITPWPRPQTAAGMLAREESRQAHRHIESMIRFEDAPQDD